MTAATERRKLRRQIIAASRCGDARRYLELCAEYNRLVKGARI